MTETVAEFAKNSGIDLTLRPWILANSATSVPILPRWMHLSD